MMRQARAMAIKCTNAAPKYAPGYKLAADAHMSSHNYAGAAFEYSNFLNTSLEYFRSVGPALRTCVCLARRFSRTNAR